MRSALLSIAVLLSSVSAARADVASDRVVLTLGAACPGNPALGREVIRVYQNPDGTFGYDPAPFLVPVGSLLEITDLELQPSLTAPPSRYQQFVALTVQNRTTGRNYVAASFTFAPDDVVATKKWTFGSGPLVAPAARLCVEVTAPLGELPETAQQLILRGKLIRVAPHPTIRLDS
jgi:hypothetical protein